MARTLTKSLKKSFNTSIVIKTVDLSFLGSVRLKGVEIRDHHNDTLIFVDKLSTSLLNAKKVFNNKVNLGSVSLEGVDFHLKTHKGETNDNLSIFIESFEDNSPRDSLSEPFYLSSSNMYLNSLNFKLIDANKKDSLPFYVKNAGGSLSDFKILGPDVTAKIRGLYFREKNGLQVTNLTTDFTYSTTNMLFKKTVLETETSQINADITFTYKREDLQFFNDKVSIKADFSKSRVSLEDLSNFYGEFGVGDVLNLDGILVGTLNDFKVNQLDINSDHGIVINGDLKFINAIDTEKGFSFDGDLQNVTANYQELKNVLPNLLGNILPTEFKRLGDFTLKGKTFVNENNLDLNVVIFSKIGTTKADLKLTNIANIDNANYKGNVELINFNIGKFFNEPLVGKITLNGDVNGTGFRVDNINTGIIGVIKKIDLNEYTYKDINVNGLFQNKLFNGNLNVSDEFLKMRFNGLADFSSKVNRFDFTATIEDADLVKTNLFTRDSISKIKGELKFDIVGNTFDDIIGVTTFNNVEYTSPKKSYTFKRFVVTSTVKDDIKSIDINSNSEANGIAQGYIKGNFKFSELIPLTQNALGSIYANYIPHKVAPNQTINYNLNIYNQIVDVFFPDIYIDENTNLNGEINTAKNIFKLNLTTPKVIAYGSSLDSINLYVNNKNIAFNTHLRVAKINTDYFNATKFNLINKTKNDTLFVKSEFKGDLNPDETFNLDFFYTLNQEKKSVLGIQKSSFDFENNIWKINPQDNKNSKVVFDLKKEEFKFSPFYLRSKEQEITFQGIVKDSTHKDLKIDFKKVKLSSLLPEIDSLSLNGILNGKLDFLQKDGQYSPKGNLSVSNFKINSFAQGDLDLNIVGENSYEKYAVDLTLKSSDRKSIFANGFIDFTDERPIIDLKVTLDKFQLKAFSPLGQDVLSKLRGEASGQFNVSGFLRNPNMKGELELKDAGLLFPYLNVDYDFEGITKIKLDQQKFIFEELKLLDTKYNTRGDFSGTISHEDFKYWKMDLNILTNNLVVLDTKETEESLYYGTAFINGNAKIYGFTDNLFIDVNATTNPNTKFVIPLNDIKIVDNYKLIQFRSSKTVTTEKEIEEFELNALKGLTLDINLEVTKDAIAEIVIDKSNGSLLNGRGNGNLKIEIDTRGKFRMDGNFIVDEGKYEFKYGGLVNKTFNVNKGGTISWDGSPSDADLNITAVYTTKANPSMLLENFNSSKKIPVNLITRISGGLFTSNQEFDIEIPNVNNAIASELEFKLNDNDVNEKTKQFLSLLVLNTFHNPDKSNFNSSNAIIGTTSNAISNLVSGLISSEDGKVQFDVDYEITDKTDVNNVINDDLVNFAVGTQISDRVMVNGKVGVPVGSKTQSSVVGEVKVEVLLNERGNFRAVIFNRQNEIQYSTEEEGYTQGIGLTYQVDFNNLVDLLRKIGLKKKKEINIEKDSVKTAKTNRFTEFKPTKTKN
ncbi:translocation/assembly module TamB domain-containing protein [Polaribacter uvawellassae]|uniref:translocation/assembly module TamB domain-containing protein n=1 Tax=Polaribacter uvawellassae TaxID=3133495 RepID=UPI00321A03C9